MRSREFLAASGFVLMAAVAGAREPVKAHGRVLDGAGKPVAKAEVATFWMAETSPMRPYEPALTDAKGEFILKVNLYGRKQALFALDKDLKTGGLAVVEPATVNKPVTIKLEPLVHVHGSFCSKELDKRLSWTNVYMMELDSKSRVLQCASKDAAFSFWLPPGKYQLWGYGTEINNYRKEITLTAGKADLDLGTIDVAATAVAKHVGKKPPDWTVTDARGVKKEIRLEDYKGKWVFLEFWGYW